MPFNFAVTGFAKDHPGTRTIKIKAGHIRNMNFKIDVRATVSAMIELIESIPGKDPE
jgi:hypothetical protein